MRDLAAEIEHDHLLAQRTHEMHVVLDQEQGDAVRAAGGRETLAQRVGLRRVEPGGGLIEQKEPRLRHQGAHKLDPLLHAVGQIADSGAFVVREVGVGERGARRLAPAVAGHEIDRLQNAAQSAVAAMLADQHVLERAEVRHQTNVLKVASDAMMDAPARGMRLTSTPSSRIRPASIG